MFAVAAAAALALPSAAAAGPRRPLSSPDAGFDGAPWAELQQRVVLRDVVPVPRLLSGPTHDDPLWLTDQPGGTVYSGTMGSERVAGWAAANSTPAKYVALRTAKDASEALAFAAKHGVAVSVKSTGHDWFGRSARAGSLLLWTHRMTRTEWRDEFTPAGCSQGVGPTVTLGAGVQFWQLYKEASERKRLVVGGDCLTVGMAGFSLAGGYGFYSRMYGSAASNLVEAEVVLADGRIVTASQCGPHADLFRAVRGGGGAFGLMTKATYKTHPIPEGKTGSAAGTLPGLHDGVARFLSWYAGVVRRGLAKHLGGVAVVGGPAGNNVSVSLRYIGLTQVECAALFAALGEVTCAADPGDLNDWFLADAVRSPNGVEGLQPQWELPDASAYHIGSATRYFELRHAEDPAFARRVAALAEGPAFKDKPEEAEGPASAPQGAWMAIALNYALGHAPEAILAGANDTTVHPQVYTGIGVVKAHILHHDMVPTAATPVNATRAAEFASLRTDLEEALPGMGSYFNEGDYLEERFQEQYWGASYPELLATKKKYDPTGAFTCHQCVGSEGLEGAPASSGRRLRGDGGKRTVLV